MGVMHFLDSVTRFPHSLEKRLGGSGKVSSFNESVRGSSVGGEPSRGLSSSQSGGAVGVSIKASAADWKTGRKAGEYNTARSARRTCSEAGGINRTRRRKSGAIS